jgi:hypothetical protein
MNRYVEESRDRRDLPSIPKGQLRDWTRRQIAKQRSPDESKYAILDFQARLAASVAIAQYGGAYISRREAAGVDTLLVNEAVGVVGTPGNRRKVRLLT